MTTAKDLGTVLRNSPTKSLIYIQAGFNRFEINSFIEENGNIILILNEEPNNPDIKEST